MVEKGLSESYLGTLIQYFDHKSLLMKKALIALKKMEGSHTGENIFNSLQTVLKDWNILEENVLYYVTDNGANVVKALKNCIYEYVPTIEDDEHDKDENLLFEGDANLDMSFMEEEVSDDINNFEMNESEHNMYFDYAKHVPCTAHQITCAIRKCVDGSSKLRPIIQAAFKLIRAFTKCGLNKEKLLLYNKKRGLLSPSQTQWIYTYYVFDRLKELKGAIEKVIIENQIQEGLDAIRWNQVEQIHDLLRPFVKMVNDLEGDKYPTLSGVIPSLYQEIKNLEDGTSIGLMRSVKKELKEELENRFHKILNPAAKDFLPTHLLATFLDPEQTVGLNSIQKEKCINIIVNQLASTLEQQNNPIYYENTFDLSKKKYPGWFKNAQLQQIPPPTLTSSPIADKAKSIKSKLEAYLEDALQLAFRASTSSEQDEHSNPIKYWCKKEDVFGEIGKYALNLLSVPATSAGIERVFSLAAIVQGGKRYQLGSANTEKELFIKVNRNFLMKAMT